MNCKNCNTEINQNYCPHCGEPAKLNRIDGKYILSEIGSVLNFDKGILFTIKELLLRPGQSIKNFISNDRNRLVKPIVFIIITSLIYSVSQQLLNFEDGYIDFTTEDKKSAFLTISNWISNNYGYSNIIMAFLIAFWIKIFFRKHNYNFFEILILLFFLMGIGMLALAVFGIIGSITHINVLDRGGAIVVFLYIFWGIGQFFGKRKIINYLKGLLSYLLGMLSFILVAFIIGLLIDLMNIY